MNLLCPAPSPHAGKVLRRGNRTTEIDTTPSSSSLKLMLKWPCWLLRCRTRCMRGPSALQTICLVGPAACGPPIVRVFWSSAISPRWPQGSTCLPVFSETCNLPLFVCLFELIGSTIEPKTTYVYGVHASCTLLYTLWVHFCTRIVYTPAHTLQALLYTSYVHCCNVLCAVMYMHCVQVYTAVLALCRLLYIRRVHPTQMAGEALL